MNFAFILFLLSVSCSHICSFSFFPLFLPYSQPVSFFSHSDTCSFHSFFLLLAIMPISFAFHLFRSLLMVPFPLILFPSSLTFSLSYFPPSSHFSFVCPLLSLPSIPSFSSLSFHLPLFVCLFPTPLPPSFLAPDDPVSRSRQASQEAVGKSVKSMAMGAAGEGCMGVEERE